MDQLWFNACGVARELDTHWQPLFSLATKIQFQQAINPVYALVVPDVSLPAKHLKKLFKSISRIAFRRFSECLYHRLIAAGIRLVKKNRPAQR